MYHSLLLLLTLALQSLTTDQNVQGWTAMELEAANTGKNAVYLNNVEKETLLYLNLARLYPKRYALLEVPKDMLFPKLEKIKWHSYRRSLLKELNTIQPLQALQPDSAMSENAKCSAVESGQLGLVGHTKINCKKENWQESCAYGSSSGREIVLHLLIDYNVSSLAHRYACLSEHGRKAGLGFAKHIEYRHCLVLVID